MIGENVEFISLADTVNAIANLIPLPTDWKWAHPNFGSKKYLLPSFTGEDRRQECYEQTLPPLELLHEVFKLSQAAAILDQAIHNAQELGPKWFSIEETGRPKVSEDAHNTGISILKEMACAFPSFDSWWKQGVSNLFKIDILTKYLPHLAPSREPWMIGANLNGRRSHQIGFCREIIINFLGAKGISHALAPSPALGSTPETPCVAVDAPSELIVTASSNAQMEKLPSERKLIKGRASDNRRHNVLDPLVDLAIEQAGNDTTATVFLQLQEMALNAVCPFTGQIVSGALEYTNVSGKKQTLSMSNLGDRLRRRRYHN